MWYEAAELIWASVVGYFKLPQPDKKVGFPFHSGYPCQSNNQSRLAFVYFRKVFQQ